jgi:hypothetical protein
LWPMSDSWFPDGGSGQIPYCFQYYVRWCAVAASASVARIAL